MERQRAASPHGHGRSGIVRLIEFLQTVPADPAGSGFQLCVLDEEDSVVATRLTNGRAEARPVVNQARKIFGIDADLWAVYAASLAFRDKLVGGIPKDAKLIEGWLRSKAGIDDEHELRTSVLRTLAEIGVGPRLDGLDVDVDRPATGLIAAHTNGFKVSPEGLYVESRQIKAMLKESTNIVFAGERWGPTRKAPKAFLAERVFVEPDRLMLGVHEPTGQELFLGHLSGPTGLRSTLGNYEYLEGAIIQFRVRVLRDCVTTDQWRGIWCHAQENGFGTLRSQGYGRFDVVRWERLLELPA